MERKALILCSIIVGVLLAAAAFGQPMTVDEVIKLVKNKISDSIIIARIEETESYFSLSTDDLIELKEAGASDNLVQYMILRKPGATTGAAITGEVNVHTTGRVSEGGTEAPAITKFVDLTVNVSGSYVVSSSTDENILYAAFVDGDKKYYVDQWTRISSFTTPETGHTTTKRVFEPKSFTVKVPTGQHTLSLVLWTGPGYVDDNSAKAYVVYTKTFNAVEGQAVALNLTGQTDAAGKFIIR